MTAGAPTVSPTLGFQEALERLRTSGLPALPVVDAGGALVGLLTLDNITDLLLVRARQRLISGGTRLFPRATSGSTPRGSTTTPRTRLPSRTR